MRPTFFLAAMAVVGGSAVALAQFMHADQCEDTDHAAHGQGGPANGPVLIETGQGSFAALSEIVRMPEGDPDTDRGRVDLAGPKTHPADLDRLISNTVVTETEPTDGLSAMATGDTKMLAKLLDESPEITGFVVPGMSDGSTGMGSDPTARYDLMAFGGDAEVFDRVGL